MSEIEPPTAVARHPVQLQPMQVPKASDVLANDLRERILRGEFPPGTALPPERELVNQTRMGRTTVREALRILEVQGLVSIKTGRAGGAFVQQPDGDAVASSVSLLIRGQQLRLTDLLETRETIEPACARLAAKYRTDEDLEALEAANSVIGDPDSTLDDFLRANVDWHLAVARAGHNELLTGFMTALSKAIYASTDNTAFVDDEVRKTTYIAHKSITAAIRAKDAAAAMRRMSKHVHSYAEAVVQVEERTEIDLAKD
ncbi:bacterial regulatory s, gntR family protein [Mycolicibacterium hassiacum DSM 44199]|jgi:DNA-binding FadR family transcriptional regulator|uniref:Bacterial regulatory s, gntR family protein n=2 Tax=Mycobacteriaceae TaxID=1762 RepID=K5BC82_MYCHD|nr:MULTISPECIES: FCD domain-containing protein [Mycolicibacterium]EKF21297.1 bacterial regulatory s, gntR family protein [Mycolicibacterium hassiacum DSM 44199]MBF4194779.1 GntR family transcriptional regulator [Mycolicibacterium phlei]MDA4087370.1 GntR family transcriptional regulator [Mycolicibacterium hassiacum DSM 44199]VCT92319.1 Pyruvate dehydrogenase complex repressor [Mycolicibacterium hassiacum DSM 44199]